MIRVTANCTIDENELEFQFTRSGGPGGQNVNKVNSRVELRFDLAQSVSLSEEQRERLIEKLANRLTTESVLRLVSQSERTQSANKRVVLERLAAILKGALHVEKRRNPTKPTKASKRRRLDAKARRGQLKKDRGGGDWS